MNSLSDKKYFFYILLVVGVFVAFLVFMVVFKGFVGRPLVGHFSR